MIMIVKDRIKRMYFLYELWDLLKNKTKKSIKMSGKHTVLTSAVIFYEEKKMYLPASLLLLFIV